MALNSVTNTITSIQLNNNWNRRNRADFKQVSS